MSETPEPLVVPGELASRVRAIAEQRETGAEEALTLLLEMVLDAFEEGPYHAKRWLLSYLETDDGPVPPAGFDKIADQYPQWTPFRVPLPKRETKQGGDDSDNEAVATAESADAPSCDLCLLRRDDGATAFLEIATTTGEALVFVRVGDQHAHEALVLQSHEAWIDVGSAVWHRVVRTADELADGLAASDGSSLADAPDE